jgi:hypothetical protein
MAVCPDRQTKPLMRAARGLWYLFMTCGLVGVMANQMIQCRRDNTVYFGLLDGANTEAMLNRMLAESTIRVLGAGAGHVPSGTFGYSAVERLIADLHLPNGLRGALEIYAANLRTANTELFGVERAVAAVPEQVGQLLAEELGNLQRRRDQATYERFA